MAAIAQRGTHRPEGAAEEDAVHPYRWTREQYYALFERGVLHEDAARVQLIEGELYEMPPQNPPHAGHITVAGDVVRSAFGPEYHVRTQLPLALGPGSEPEPDIAVALGSSRDYLTEHPKSAALVVEVADTSREFDRQRKGSMYARYAILDYWVLNVVDRRLEVYRDPGPDATAPYGYAYRTRTVLVPGDTVSLLLRPQAMVAVADLLP